MRVHYSVFYLIVEKFALYSSIDTCVNFWFDGRGVWECRRNVWIFSCNNGIFVRVNLLLCWPHANSCNIIIVIICIFTLIKCLPTQRQKSILNFFFIWIHCQCKRTCAHNNVHMSYCVYLPLFSHVWWFIYQCVCESVCFVVRLFAICCYFAYNMPLATELNQIGFEIMLHLRDMWRQ